MNRASLLMVLIGILILAGIFLILQKNDNDNSPTNTDQTSNQQPQPIQVVVSYNPAVKFEPQTTRVQEGSSVTIKATSAVADELHLHGYDLHTDLEPAIMGEIKFTADKTGRFEFELEDAKIILGVIEVYPK